MIKKLPLPYRFNPDYEKDYEVFGGSRVDIRIQYIGPIPELNKPMQPEVFLYAICQGGKRLESGRVEWNPNNGPITLEEVGKILAVMWDTRSSDF